MAQVEIIAANLKSENNNSFAKNTKKKVAAYARVSSDSEEQLNSYSSQIKYYTEKIKANPEWEFVGIYADEGISGTQVKNRTEFQRMIDDALNGKIDIILAKSISRFARNTLDTLKYVRDLRDHKVDVYFEKENIHTLELDSEMFLTLYSAFAQAESESTSQNVKLGLRAMMKRGECVGRANPYGYNWDKDTKTLTINEEEAEVVRMIFNWYVSGIGTRVIAKKLNEMDIPSPGGKIWSQQYVRTMISQEKYVGDLLGQKNYTVSPLTHKKVRNYGEKAKYYVKNHHIPIISREIWDKAQEILKKRSNKIIPEGGSHNSRFSLRYPFSSKIVCGFCGTNYSRRVSGANKSGFKKVYWTCYKHVVEANDCAESHGIREEILQNAFVELYNSVMKNKYKTKDLMLNAIKDVVSENDYKKKKDNLLKEKETLEKRLSNLLDLKLDDFDNKELYISKEEEINTKLKTITEKIKNYDALTSENKMLSKQIKEIEKHFENPEVITEFDEEAFNNMIDRIIIGDYNNDGTPNPNIIRFILKIGGEYVLDLDYENESEISEEESVSFAQRKRTYIVCENDFGLYLIDQHAAKERVNYELVEEAFRNKKITTIDVLIPITIELNSSDFLKIKEHMDILEDLGLTICEFGLNTYKVLSHPSWLKEGHEEEIIRSIFDEIVNIGSNFDRIKFNNKVIATIACKMSVRANTKLSIPSMEEIIRELMECKNPYNCAHGRPTIVKFSTYELEKMFKRVMN